MYYQIVSEISNVVHIYTLLYFGHMMDSNENINSVNFMNNNKSTGLALKG